MPGTLFGYPFNEELFDYNWKQAPNPVTTAIIDSGVMQYNDQIAELIQPHGSHLYTIPFYNKLGGTVQNYDGDTDVTFDETTGAYQQGVVFGRMKGWSARDFVRDHNSGADPMGSIVRQCSTWWDEYHQGQIVQLLAALFAVTGTGDYYTAWAEHTLDLSAAEGGTVADSNLIGETTIEDACVQACGDLAQGKFALAFMNSAVANRLSALQLLNYRKYTDPAGIERQLPIADANGKTVIVTDLLTATGSGTTKKYTTYVLGKGMIQYADAPVSHPVEGVRDAITKGGYDKLIMRERRSLHPNGFTFVPPETDSQSLADADLFAAARWAPIFDPKTIGAARIVTNG